jgi:2-methylcitrate dehydratase PrpD
LLKQHHVLPKDVESVKVKGDPQMTVPLIYMDPKTALEGKFSIQFPLALGLSERRVVLQDFTDEKIKDPAILSLMPKISLIPDPELRCKDPHMRASVVEIHLKDGRTLVLRCDYPPGTPENPIPEEEVLEKYKSCAQLILEEREIKESVEMITHLETLDNVKELANLLRGKSFHR